MGKELIVYEQEHDIAVTKEPDIVLVEAQKAAKALTKVIDGRKKKLILGGKTYLFNEDWQTVGKFYGVTAKIVETQYVEYGDTKGFEAKAEAIRADGMIVSGAEAMCLNDEKNWKSRAIYKDNKKIGEEPVPLYQLKSMAQTRACSKVLKNVLAWVVVLAGYEPTPAEEMTGNESKLLPSEEKPELTPEQKKLWTCLVQFCGADKQKVTQELKTRTTWTVSKGEDKGKQIQGKESIYDISDTQAKTVRHQIEKELEKNPPEPDILKEKCGTCDVRVNCEQIGKTMAMREACDAHVPIEYN